MTTFDLNQTDTLLSTTRAVRKRLDLDKPVPRSVVNECLELAVQAPTGSNSQTWRWVCVEDAAKRKALAELYANAGRDYLTAAGEQANESGAGQTKRVFSSALFLLDNLHKVPLHVIPCVEGRPDPNTPAAMMAGLFGSIFPAVWSFQLALRSRGLGSTLTTLHLLAEKQAAEILGLPENVMQVALLPVAYTKGTDFQPASRPPVAEITHWDSWQG